MSHSLVLKIRSGTARSDTNLCDSCTKCFRRRDSLGETTRICTAQDINTELFRPIVECTKYCRAGEPSLYDMKEVAHILRVSSSGQVVGFVSNKDYREKHGGEDLDNLY